MILQLAINPNCYTLICDRKRFSAKFYGYFHQRFYLHDIKDSVMLVISAADLFKFIF